MDRYRIIEVKQSVFADNDAAAERLRGELDAQGTYLINLMSSPAPARRRRFCVCCRCCSGSCAWA